MKSVVSCLYAHEIIILVFISFATQEINNEIAFSWVHKQFAAPDHTLFSIRVTDSDGNILLASCNMRDTRMCGFQELRADFSVANHHKLGFCG